MAVSTKKRTRRPPARKPAAPTPAAFTGLDFTTAAAADRLRNETGVLVDLRPRWRGLRPRLVSLKHSEMQAFMAKTKRDELNRYNLERGQRKPRTYYEQLPQEAKRRCGAKIILAMLRGDGRGCLRWEEDGELRELDLDGAPVEQVREAFGAVLAREDCPEWFVLDLLAAGALIETLSDETLLDAEKKGLACGLQRQLERLDSALAGGAGPREEVVAAAEKALASLQAQVDKAIAEGKAAKAAKKTPTSKPRSRRKTK